MCRLCGPSYDIERGAAAVCVHVLPAEAAMSAATLSSNSACQGPVSSALLALGATAGGRC